MSDKEMKIEEVKDMALKMDDNFNQLSKITQHSIDIIREVNDVCDRKSTDTAEIIQLKFLILTSIKNGIIKLRGEI